ncbi:MAG: hypothetical protein HYU53_12285 [Acidobacteria bacterium]|nr:hypothetical protein [Acidobacteriota bacterium]
MMRTRLPFLFLLIALAAGGPLVAAQTPRPGAPAPTVSAAAGVSYQYGRLAYRQRSSGRERGVEHWSLTRNRDGSRTMRSVAMTADSQFVRDVTYTLGADRRPRDAFVRLQLRDRLVGTGYFRTAGDQLHITTDTADTGHTVQVVPVPPRFHVTTHAVMLDGWPFWAYDAERGGEQALPVYNTSTRWNGTDGPLGRLETLRVRALGEETITVPAGTFTCRHYRFESDAVPSPPSDVWVTGEDDILVRYDWGELDLEYVLTSWVREP